MFYNFGVKKNFMITFLSSIVLLILGYIFYGKFVEKFFGADPQRLTPAYAINDGVDYIPMPLWKVFIIQFLNIAGLGPIFGAILGAMYGPLAYVWIVLGSIFMGGVHDYFSGMLSIRNNGASLPELVGKYLGNTVKQILRVFTLILLIFVGLSFVTGPAELLQELTSANKMIWLYIIFGYYIIATLLPIDKIIGKIYPIFVILVLIMAFLAFIGIIIKYFSGNFSMIELSIANAKNWHIFPDKNILYPMMFIVISCGAISGFHSTQSPMMARCIKNENQGRKVFYGAMIAEGIVAIIWATVAMNYFGGVENLNAQMAAHNNNAAWLVDLVSRTWFGKIGAVFAIIGVVALPITTGDTAFRSARLTAADMFGIDQSKIMKRILISLPFFIIGFIMSQLEFATVWRYLGISNQSLACFVLWTGAMYLAENNKPHWILSIPALIITTICFTYFFIAPNIAGGLNLPGTFSYPAGFIAALVIAALWYRSMRKKQLAQKDLL